MLVLFSVLRIENLQACIPRHGYLSVTVTFMLERMLVLFRRPSIERLCASSVSWLLGTLCLLLIIDS
jgi:hypothetical protein